MLVSEKTFLTPFLNPSSSLGLCEGRHGRDQEQPGDEAERKAVSLCARNRTKWAKREVYIYTLFTYTRLYTLFREHVTWYPGDMGTGILGELAGIARGYGERKLRTRQEWGPAGHIGDSGLI